MAIRSRITMESAKLTLVICGDNDAQTAITIEKSRK